MLYGSHKYYNENLYASIAKDVKNEQLFMDLHAGIAMDIKKQTTITRPICRYCNGCKRNQKLLQNLYVGITMVVKKTRKYYETYMWVLHI